ncbi:hypothetical protein Ccrd_005961 [Cynara cardunculus var. scolymus]|uniref:FeS cluster biogenesis n=1 Tax=Cynara cardunculus var. scolymus TaxID=59895 RepID=A0A103XJS3_CYNCS|nr:hypothetical protein Ccrd_005961 [Cynara cardunculus var. scolymus]
MLIVVHVEVEHVKFTSKSHFFSTTFMASMAFSSTVRSFSLYRLPNTSSSSSTFVPPASLSTRSLPSRLNLNLRRKNFFIRSISTQAAPASGGLAPAIALTDNALEHLNKMRSERSEDLCLRIGVKQVCDPKSLLFIFGMQLDFSDALIGGGFSFKNPNATQTCGCGKSFAAEM